MSPSCAAASDDAQRAMGHYFRELDARFADAAGRVLAVGNHEIEDLEDVRVGSDVNMNNGAAGSIEKISSIWASS